MVKRRKLSNTRVVTVKNFVTEYLTDKRTNKPSLRYSHLFKLKRTSGDKLWYLCFIFIVFYYEMCLYIFILSLNVCIFKLYLYILTFKKLEPTHVCMNTLKIYFCCLIAFCIDFVFHFGEDGFQNYKCVIVDEDIERGGKVFSS